MGKFKLILILAVLITAGGTFFLNNSKPEKIASTAEKTLTVSENESPKVLSTKPDPLEEAIVSVNEIIEVTFNRALENEGEFKLRIEPKNEFKIQLTQDRKTARITPLKPYELGATYTLFIGTDTKFDGVGAWGQEKIFHFKTIRYRGV